MSSCDNTEEDNWGSRRTCLSAMFSQTLGLHTFLILPHHAFNWGAAGQSVVIALVYIVVGIPLFYMESVVGQFTGRDCLEVWHARPCLSHFGYVHILCQIVIMMYLHSVNAFVVHYFLISFENPIPYYMCGKWSKPDCDILNYNYSVNQDCLKMKEPLPYCDDLCNTFPEYQYWRFNLLGLDKPYYYWPWRVCLASGLLAMIMFLSCFRQKQTKKWVLLFVTTVPACARILFMIGSLLQKGLVVKYDEAFDSDFSVFTQRFSLSDTVAEVLYCLNLGTGLAFNCASRTSFRAPCYSNTVIVVAITCCITILGIYSTVMMTCPYAFKYDIEPIIIMKYPITNIFEKIPRLVHVYESTSFWLIICFTYASVSAMGLSICIISSLIEKIAKRSSKITKNPGLTAFVTTAIIYLVTTPLLGNMTLYFMADVKNTINVLLIFLVMIETFVFVLWYGLERFSEDVHFMQGVQPNASVKACWLISAAILVYVFITQLYDVYKKRHGTPGLYVAWYILVTNIFITTSVTIVKLLVALYKKKIHEQVSLDPTWGPKSEILKRSRAMFTAQAMTKEYMYRQYHLQAGIMMRQKRSNMRMCYKTGLPQKPVEC